MPDITTWEWIRTAGFTSYSLLFLSVMAGAAYSGNMVNRTQKALFLFFHQFAGWIGFLAGLFHGLVLLVDNYVSFTFVEVFIPFASEYKPVFTGLGILSFYLLLIVLLSSDLRTRIGNSLWRKTHFLAVPAYIMALIHGLFTGTDTGQIWAIGFYSSTSAIIFAVVLFRMLSAREIPSHKRSGV